MALDVDYDAVVLDLDGVVTRTATLHAQAWKKAFDDYLERRLARGEPGFAPFDPVKDYIALVDGKPRADGVRSFLTSRGIKLPDGQLSDPPEAETVNGLGHAKDKLFKTLLIKRGPDVFEDAVHAIQSWRIAGKKLGIASSSKNCKEVLRSAGLIDCFDAIVDGNDLDNGKLRGKPAPDMFLEACRRLGVVPARTIMIEDAISGVQAGRAGNFARVIGVARRGPKERLEAAGADLVVRSLEELLAAGPELKESRDSWALKFTHWDSMEQPSRESLCTLGNGYFATRGAAEEAGSGGTHYPGTYLAGGYNRLRSEVAGQFVEHEDLVNWPNWLRLTFRPADGSWLDIDAMDLLEFEQELDLLNGLLTRKLRVRDDKGRETRLVSRRIVSMADPHLAAIQWELTPLNWSGALVIQSVLDGTVVNANVERYKSLANRHLSVLEAKTEDHLAHLVVETNQSHLRAAQACRTRVAGTRTEPRSSPVLREGWAGHEYTVEAAAGQTIAVEKTIAFYCARDHAISDPLEAAREAVERAGSFDVLRARHSMKWKHLWRSCDIVLGGRDHEQMVLRLHVFHLLQTVSMNTVDRDVGVPARGLHGEAYRGHVFWDELFIFPFFNFRIPELTRELLTYRYRRLPEARYLARQAGFKGAMYPWQSGSTGREESPRIHLNPRSGRWLADDTHLQRHVNSAIVYSIWQYYQVTEDKAFLSFYGAEVMFEIARFWSSIAAYNPGRGRYDIRKVVGPDEFHTRYPGSLEPGIDNNAYTNIMASWAIQKAIQVYTLLDDERRSELKEGLQLSDGEIAHWDEVSRKLYVPFHGNGIISAFEGYEKLEELDVDAYRRKYGDVQRLDRILELEGSSAEKYKAGKQADVLMLFYLFSTEELQRIFHHLGYPFDPAMIPRNVHRYLSYSSHGSTLSRAIHSWVLVRSDRERSWTLFRDALESDLVDIQGTTTREGIHLGAMAETVDLVQRCYPGLEVRDEILWVNPCLPEPLSEIRVRIRFRGHWISLQVTHERLRISVDRSWFEAAKIGFGDKIYALRQGDRMEFDIKARCLVAA